MKVVRSRCVREDQRNAAPQKGLSSQAGDENIGSKTSMPPIAVWKGVNRNKAVVESNGKLVRGVRGVCDLVRDVITQGPESFTDLLFRCTDVLVSSPYCPSPAPRVAEHSPMEVKEPGNRRDCSLSASSAAPERPGVGFVDIRSLKFIELAASLNTRDQPFLLLLRQRSSPCRQLSR